MPARSLIVFVTLELLNYHNLSPGRANITSIVIQTSKLKPRDSNTPLIKEYTLNYSRIPNLI